MKIKTFRIVSIILLSSYLSSIKAEITPLSLDTIQNYKDWGWEALVIRNEYITVAIVPAMGGNILQYDFGVDTFLKLEPNTFGKSYVAGSGDSPFNNSWGFGGLEIWPTPEAWPPPPNLTYRKFSYVTETCNADSIVINLKSIKETETFPGIQFERRISVNKKSTRVKIENTMINLNASQVSYGMMNVAYVDVQHNTLNDYDNFSISFPVNQASKFEKDGVYFAFGPKFPSFLGQINPGIYSVEYKPSRQKIYADVNDGWGSYVDKRDSQAYIRVFNIFEGEAYPDDGARFEVYVSDNPQFMAIEVMSPIKKLSANGGQYTFEDNLYSTKLNNTILKATHAGATLHKLHYDSISNLLSGTYGVFNKGYVQLSYYDSAQRLLNIGDSFSVNPDSTFVLNLSVSLPNKTNYIKLSAYNVNNELIDILDEKDFSEKEIVDIKDLAGREKTFLLLNNTITDGNTNLNYQINNCQAGNISIIICDFSGKCIDRLYDGYLQPGIYNWQHQVNDLNSGVYIVVFSSDREMESEKILVIE